MALPGAVGQFGYVFRAKSRIQAVLHCLGEKEGSRYEEMFELISILYVIDFALSGGHRPRPANAEAGR